MHKPHTFRTCLALLVASVPTLRAQDAALEWTEPKRTAAAAVDARAETLVDASRRIWELAELALKEHRSSELLAALLEQEGFTVERGVSDMPTAFVASYGEGHPIVAYLAEFDALPGLSQRVAPVIDVLVPGAGGHGCGHNLFGAGSVGAGIALKAAMQKHDLAGTVRVYGTPAEEQGIGKVFMVRDGLFDDVDACLSWHPSNENSVSVDPSKALRSFEVTFYGRSAHAAGAPWKGVSALDAVEAFETGLNLLREHMPESARIHYVVTDGGQAPNVIPARASIWLFTRGKDWPEEEQVYEHVLKIVEGADLMAWGEEHGRPERGYRAPEVDVFTGLYHYNPNHAAARAVHANLVLVGPADYTEAEHVFARHLQTAFEVEPDGMHTTVTPFDPDAAPEPGGSTDVANVSWICPTIDLSVANWPQDVPAHSWASTAASGSSAAYKAMLVASKVLAAAGVDVLTKPELVRAMRAEFEEQSKTFPYVSPVGPEVMPGLPSHMRGD
ncbi:MAG: amidohydrolase [Planctomycetota bacterium]|nr:MAG: amidohydrolase [Planctomycetota bacterium]